MKKSVIIFVFLFCINKNQAQIIPDSLRVDWSQAGYQGTIPEPSLIINVKDFGAYGDSLHDDYNAIMNAVNFSSSLRVIYFPAGKYLIKSPIAIPQNVVFRGDGISSNLLFDLSQYQKSTDCITINKTQKSSYTSINSGYTKNSTILTVANSTGFTVNGYAEIKENNGDWDPDKSQTYLGQIVKVTAINGNTITITPALRIDYIDSLLPKIRPVTLIENAGLECFKITRLDSPTVNYSGKNISLQYANNCWITGVESEYCQTAHMELASCTHITVSGCYVHDAFTYNGGGQAYGIFMHAHTSDSKVENSVFERLRHAMILAAGANGNVYAYNYSTDPRSTTEIPPDNIGDLSLHGHYAYANLFEGNIVQNLIVDDYWGASGPYNTFFRNREELYGIEILDQYGYAVKSQRQNIVGNEVTNVDSLKGNYVIQTANNFTYNNNIKNTFQPAGTDTLNDVSYYLTSKPYFWNVNSAWPSIGGNNILASGTIPAKERYASGNNVTICSKPPSSKLQITISADSIKCNEGVSHIIITATGGAQPYTGTGEFYKPAGNYSFVVTDAFGYSDSVSLNLNQPLPITASANTTASETCKPNGSIAVVNVSGGNPPYYFSLNGSSYTSDSVFNNLSYGKYFVVVKDANGCIDSINNIIVTSHPTIIITAKITNASACKNDGSINVKRTGGQSPFKYSIDGINYVSTYIFYNLAPGSYTVCVKDKTGCKDSLQNIVVGSTPAISVSLKKTNVSCKNANDGSITIKASGGTKPYLYSIDSTSYTSNNTFTNLRAGTYITYTKDVSGCIKTSSAVIKNSTISCGGLNIIAKSNNDIQLTISPNPSTQNFIVTMKKSNKQALNFYVTDMYGRIVYKVSDETKNVYSFGENFAPGVYMLQLMQGSNVKMYKLVKQ